MQLKPIFTRAYGYMDQTLIDGNCGELCNYHCCRPSDEGDNSRLGMYLLPYEYEAMQEGHATDYTIHTKHHYELPPGVRSLYYIYCPDDTTCLRHLRPIQCRTYPFEPHLDGERLVLIIEAEQIHKCPLLDKPQMWRPEFIQGIYKGWQELLTIPEIKTYIRYYSQERIKCGTVGPIYYPT